MPRVPLTTAATLRGTVPPLLIPVYFATPQTHTYPQCVLVPSWVVSGPHYARGANDDTTPCAVGLAYSSPEGLPEEARCDFCPSREGVAMDENASVYCEECLRPGGDTYGVVQTRFLHFVPFEG